MKQTVPLLLTVALLLLAGCSPRARTDTHEAPEFIIDPALVGDLYENEQYALRIRPPLNWDRLEGERRQAIRAALEESEDDDEYSLAVLDVFFDFETLSFLSLSAVAAADGVSGLAAHADTFAATIGLGEDDAADEDPLLARTQYDLNGIAVVQFRHLAQNRVTFTLLFAGPGDEVLRLDYSIPTDSYQRESLKLESSIGTLQQTRRP